MGMEIQQLKEKKMTNKDVYLHTSDNNVIGNFNAINYYNYYTLSPSKNVFRNLLLNLENNEDTKSQIKEDLDDFIGEGKERDIIGLKQKLINGGRESKIEDASYSESFATRKISQNQFSVSTQAIFLHLLTIIETKFETYIYPLFEENETPKYIDKEIYEKIVLPLFEDLSEIGPMYTQTLINSLIYFLTGKCYIVWCKK